MDTNDEFNDSGLVVPATMRSKYWKYFGFPADSENKILTKNKIICSLCNSVIAYNKNTTNLRMHLGAKHPDVFYEIQMEKKAAVDESPAAKKMKFPLKSDIKEVHSPKKESIYNAEDFINDMTEDEQSNEQLESKSYAIILQEIGDGTEQQHFDIEEIDDKFVDDTKSSAKSEANENATNLELLSSICSMVHTDLLPSSIVEGVGFKNFVTRLRPDLIIPSQDEVEAFLEKTHEQYSLPLENKIKQQTKSNPFSLGIEKWQNHEDVTFLTIFINYVENSALKSLHLSTIKFNELQKFENLLNEIDISNCTAIVTNSDVPEITHLHPLSNAITITSFEHTIQKCLSAAFDADKVKCIVNYVLSIAKKYCTDDPLIKTALDRVRDQFPLTKYNFLKLISEYDFNYKVTGGSIAEHTKEIIDCLTPLKITLETICTEPTALSSFIMPLSHHLVQNNFKVSDDDSEIVSDIKDHVVTILKEQKFTDSFLLVSSFLDPRFQPFIDSESILTVKQTLNSMTEDRYKHEKPESFERPETNENKTKIASSLSFFFATKANRTSKNCIDIEIRNYRTETVDLEQCPISWWEENGNSYKYLRRIANEYNCVPCCVNSIFKLSLKEQIDFYSRRFMLSNANVCQILDLYFNKNS